MQIDWITVAAQVVNFLVLVWLLQRFLYGPITRAMQRREETIRGRLEEAKAEKEKAETKARDLDNERQRLEDQRQDFLAQARADADNLRKRLEQEARESAQQQRDEWLKQIRKDQAAFLDEMRTRSASAFRELAADALQDLAGSSLHDELAARFIERLKALDQKYWADLQDAARSAGAIAVEAGGALDADTRRQLTRYLHDSLGKEVEVEYRERPELGLGLRLKSRGQTIEWSTAHYLDRYVDRLRDAFPQDGGRPTGERRGKAETEEVHGS